MLVLAHTAGRYGAGYGRYAGRPSHEASANAVAWSPDGKWIASGGNDGTVYVWEATTGEPVAAYREHVSWIDKGLVWSPEGTLLASSALDGVVRVWEAFSGTTRVVYQGHHSLVRSLTRRVSPAHFHRLFLPVGLLLSMHALYH